MMQTGQHGYVSTEPIITPEMVEAEAERAEKAEQIEFLERYRQILEKCITYKTEVEPEVPILLSNGCVLLTRGGVSVIGGAPKSRKSFFVSSIITAILTGKFGVFEGKDRKPCDRPIIHIDTEQSKSRVGETFERIARQCTLARGEELTDENVNEAKRDLYEKYNLFPAVGCTAKEIREVLDILVRGANPLIAFVDVGTDLLTDTNDNAESAQLMAKLLKMADEYNMHVCIVAHTNPVNSTSKDVIMNATKVRGHFGSEAERRCECEFILTLNPSDEDETIANIKVTRHARPDTDEWAFKIECGMTSYVDTPTEPTYIEAKRIDTLTRVFTDILSGGVVLKHNDLMREVVKRSEVQPRTARRQIKEATENKVLEQTEKGYRLKPHTIAVNIQQIEYDEDMPF